ncbi:hypothetical protein [Streptomyces stelliscabiei]|uniref:Uncharacterized protein n=1 Tax=Streptomyces stelliscabiei TaxID=146820 RepID=A0A8I0P7I7_9ACTN|nr:hypothetical protein [Streptomyces stelliscabiei]KND29923.1 hypothetical protein IQ64_41635 [Streptomyces stelliscabiei]MBE1598962.1 hypothetical protein [Streptomyces stelliscabiei]
MSDESKRRVRRGKVATATAAEIKDLGIDATASAPAATALRLATLIDSTSDAKETAAAARELRQAMQVVRALAPPKDAGDRIDQLAARRRARLSPPARKGSG